MKSPLDSMSATIRSTLQDELLCIADTKLVLGNWFAECVMNGKSLPDFAAMLGMCTASYGHARSLYHFLDTLDYSYGHLERGRGPGEIHSMNLLDEPPVDWPDLIVTTWLAEQATWSMESGFLHSPDPTVAGIARKLGEEAYFHLKYASGWLEIMRTSEAERRRVIAALGSRYPLAIGWFGPAQPPGHDDLHEAGWRDDPLPSIRSGFQEEVQRAVSPFGVGLADFAAPDVADGWRARARRTGPLPDGLFEVIRFKDPELAR